MTSSSQPKLTAAVIGGGYGGQLSMKALSKSDRYDLVAATDLRAEVGAQLAETFPGLHTFTDHHDMFAACPTDVICVSTWPPSHESITLDALSAPSLRGLLVEKPLGHTAASGRRLLDAIKQKNLPVAVPHGLVANETPREIITRVQRGDIGDLKLVEIQCDGWDIINAGIHWIHFFVSLTGGEAMDSVMALCESSTRTYRDGMQVETTAVTYAQTATGVRVVMHTGDKVMVNREGKDTLFRIVGTAGQIEFWGWQRGYHIINADHPRGETITPDPMPVRGHQYHLERLADMIESGEADYTVADHSLLALEICEGAYVSSRHRAKVTFPVDAFEPKTQPQWDPGMPYSGEGGGRNGRT